MNHVIQTSTGKLSTARHDLKGKIQPLQHGLKNFVVISPVLTIPNLTTFFEFTSLFIHYITHVPSLAYSSILSLVYYNESLIHQKSISKVYKPPSGFTTHKLNAPTSMKPQHFISSSKTQSCNNYSIYKNFPHYINKKHIFISEVIVFSSFSIFILPIWDLLQYQKKSLIIFFIKLTSIY